MQEAYDFLQKCGVFYLATSEEGQPRVRPFGALDLFEGRIYTLTDRRKAVSRQMGANPRVELCAYDGERWMRLEATAVCDERLEAKRHVLEANPAIRSLYSAEDDKTQVWYFADAQATFYVFDGAPRAQRSVRF